MGPVAREAVPALLIASLEDKDGTVRLGSRRAIQAIRG